MNKPIAVFDLDDTLINFKETLYQAICKRLGKNNIPHWCLWDEHGVEKYCDLTLDDIRELSIEDQLFKIVEPHFFSPFILKDLSERGFHIVILTAREGFVPNPYNSTQKYLIDNDLYHDELIISKHGENKMEYLAHYNEILFAVDDQIKNCEQFRDSKKIKHVFLHALPHNKDCTEFLRLHNLYQLYPHIGLN